MKFNTFFLQRTPVQQISADDDPIFNRRTNQKPTSKYEVRLF